MDIILWIVFGALVGWVASMIMGTNQQQGGLANIVIGIVGALLGGWVSRAFGGEGVSGFNLSSLLIAIVGAILLIGVLKLFYRGTRTL